MADAAPSSRPEQNRLLGIALRIGATTCFAFMAAMIKLGYARGVSTPELGWQQRRLFDAASVCRATRVCVPRRVAAWLPHCVA